MALRKVNLENFTTFSNLDMKLNDGINVFIGENGTGKTHIMKVLYAACQARKTEVSFADKLVKVFKPDNMKLSRLVNRKSINSAKITVSYDNPNNINNVSKLSLEFTNDTKKWDGKVSGEENWEKICKDIISTYIPAKDILANSNNFLAAYNNSVIDFDETYKDIISSATANIPKGSDTRNKKKYLNILKNITTGEVAVSNERFYLKSESQSNLEFHLISEGWRKLALLWQLINNGTLDKGTILFWDEPETNVNPIVIKALVDILLELQKDGVQIFISTHDYIFAKYLEVRATNDNDIAYYSLYKNEKNDIECEKCRQFIDLEKNPIIKAYDNLLDEIMNK